MLISGEWVKNVTAFISLQDTTLNGTIKKVITAFALKSGCDLLTLFILVAFFNSLSFNMKVDVILQPECKNNPHTPWFFRIVSERKQRQLTFIDIETPNVGWNIPKTLSLILSPLISRLVGEWDILLSQHSHGRSSQCFSDIYCHVRYLSEMLVRASEHESWINSVSLCLCHS